MLSQPVGAITRSSSHFDVPCFFFFLLTKGLSFFLSFFHCRRSPVVPVQGRTGTERRASTPTSPTRVLETWRSSNAGIQSWYTSLACARGALVLASGGAVRV